MTDQPIRILYIDLESQTSEIKAYPDLARWLGGIGVSTALLAENLEAAPFVLSRGPFAGVFPGCSGSFASFVSPLSRNLGESWIGGSLGLNLARAGLEGIVVLGKSKKPVVIEVINESVNFASGEDYWGKSPVRFTDDWSARVGSATSILAIGPASEHGVRFGNVLADQSFPFGPGLGAVWGKAKLKGMAISGDHEIALPENKKFQELRERLGKSMNDLSPESLRFRVRERSQKLLEVLGRSRGLMVSNLQGSRAWDTDIVGFFDAVGFQSCVGCPLECGQAMAEAWLSLGPLLGLQKKEEIITLVTMARDFGLDPVSLGAVLAWFVESEGWEFGDLESYRSLILALVAREEDWARKISLGLGSSRGREQRFALNFLGNLGLPFFSGYLSILARLFSPGILEWEGCLLDLSLAENPISSREMVQALLAAEGKKTLILALVGCGSLATVYDLPLVFAALESLGLNWSHENLENLARSIYNQRWQIRMRLGFSWDELNVPERLFEVPSATGGLERGRFEELLQIYRETVMGSTKLV